MAQLDTTATATGTSIQGIDLYPIEPYLVIVLALLVVGCFQWGAYFRARCDGQKSVVQDEESARSSRRRSWVSRFPLAATNFFRALAFRTTLGFRSYMFSLAEVFVTVAYIALLIMWTFAIESDPDGEPLNWCSRAALLAASQFPFVTILGTKNNIVSLVTRISPDKLNFLHRIAARACLVFIGMHALGGVNNFSFYAHASREAEMFGVIAALVFVGLAIVSIRPVREKAYELFFYIHSVAVTVIMVATILHIRNYSGSSFTFYIWPSFIIWAADRLIRTSRLLYFNFAYFCSSRQPGMLDGTTELLSESVIRVKVRRPDSFRWSPGQFAYLIMPSVSRLPFEAHPFSIASVDSSLFVPDTKSEEHSYAKELVFLIGVKSGFTRRLKDVAARGERVKVYIDGPYGEGVDSGCYNTSLLIAGGTGISFALPALLNAVESVRNGSSCCRRVVLIWTIRDADFLDSVSESLAKANRFAPPGLEVDIRVFLTRNRPRLPSGTPERRSKFEDIRMNPFEDQNPFENPTDLSEKLEERMFSAPWVNITRGRPSLEHILSEEINAASGSVAVNVCGPNAMAEAVRKALRFPWSSPSSPLKGGPSVTLHVARFGYA